MQDMEELHGELHPKIANIPGFQKKGVVNRFWRALAILFAGFENAISCGFALSVYV